jgi:hypothetical protein
MARDILELFERIPASFWGVVVGSFFSITGVALTNRASDHRLGKQFEHERLQKTKDHEMVLKKEVYLAAAEAISAGINSIGRFANLDLPNDQITISFIEKVPAISKVHVIAKTETVQTLVEFMGELNSVFLILYATRFELLAERGAILNLDAQIAEYGKSRDRFLEMIKQYNIEGNTDGRRLSVLQGNFDFEQKRIYEALNCREKLASSIRPKHLEFMRETVSQTSILSRMLIPLLSAVRAELELPYDENSYRIVVEEGNAKQLEAMDGFIKKI